MYLVEAGGGVGGGRSAPELSVRIGKLLLDAGRLTERDVAQIVEAQQRFGLRFGEAGLKLGVIRESDLMWALSQQFDYPCMPDEASALSPALVAAHQPFGPHSEALRELRSQLVLRWLGPQRKALAVVGVSAGAGGSTLSANLAISLAQLGLNTLLIDANLRRPTQQQLFGLPSDRGLSTLLNGQHSLEECVVPLDAIWRLGVLCAGPLPPNPQELLMRSAFPALLESVCERFDVVVIDAGSAQGVADAQVVAVKAGSSLLVAERHKTRASVIAQVKEQFSVAGVHIVGAILNHEREVPRASGWRRLLGRWS